MERADLARLVEETGVTETRGPLVFLRDPHWSVAQQAAFDGLLESEVAKLKSPMEPGWLAVATGGSSGGLRFARHDEITLGAAARGFATHFGLGTINAVDVLPPWHVSGLLARVRCAVTSGRHLPWTWKQLEAGDLPDLPRKGDWVLSLVPTQVQRLLARPRAVAWLRQLRLLLVGGGPAWPGLIEAMLAAKVPAVLSYGMTETAAMVTAQLPADLAGGDRSSGRVMPHARISIRDDVTGERLAAGETGAIHIEGASVMHGYVGAAPVRGVFAPADLGWLDAKGRLHVVGRRDDAIITGGEKVNPREVEALLRATECFEDLAIIGLPHAEWGEEVTACYVPVDPKFDPFADTRAITRHLSRHQRPKRWVRFDAADWPRNAQGKLNRIALKAIASTARDPGR